MKNKISLISDLEWHDIYTLRFISLLKIDEMTVDAGYVVFNNYSLGPKIK